MASPASKQRVQGSSPAKQQQPQQQQEHQQAAANGDTEDNELLALAQSIAENAHLLVRGKGSDELAERARNVVKRSFDLGAFPVSP